MVAEATVISDVFSKIYSILNSNVQNITDASGSTITLRKSGDNYWLGAYPDVNVDDKSNYPMGIIHTPNKTRNIVGLKWREDPITIRIEVLATRAEHPPKFIEKVEKALEDSYSDLRDAGLFRLNSDTTSTDFIMRDDIKIHTMEVPIDLTFGFEA